MTEKTDAAVTAGRRHIISRPRLTRLLDETTARIILLVAPAGYGKTTLAREWLEGRPHAWYRGTPASADVAALAVGLAEAVATLVPGAGQRMRERLRVTEAPARDLEVLADLLVNDLMDWPSEMFLAIDDLHFLTAAREAELFLRSVINRVPARVLLTSRTRPQWVTARQLLYGETFELGRAALAMSADEGRLVLSARSPDEVPGLLALAEGWPAVLGLAALAHDLDLSNRGGRDTVYDFFAEELFHGIPDDLQAALAELALAPVVTPGLARLLFGDHGEAVLADATRLGLLTVRPAAPYDSRGADDSARTYDLHPLLREFLRGKAICLDTGDGIAALDRISRFFLARRQWDEVFAVIERFSASQLLVDLVEAALPEFIASGRLSTLAHWLEYAETARLNSPVFDLAEAELAFREGAHAKAHALALEARHQLSDEHPLVARALALAGESAYQLDRSDVALQLHRDAARHARVPTDRQRAMWGQLLAAIQLESPVATELLDEVERSYERTVDGTLRRATARLLFAATSGHLERAANSVRPFVYLVDRSRDPKIRTSFLYLLASALGATANYSDALVLTERANEDAHAYRLDFTQPFALLVESTAMIGLRKFSEAAVLLDQCAALALRNGDVFLELGSRTARSKLLLAHGAYDEAIAATLGEWRRIPGPVVFGELLGVRALALACADRPAEAIATATEAEDLTRSGEAQTLAACARAVVSCELAATPSTSLRDAFATAARTENYDSLVAALRGAPSFARAAGAADNHRGLVAELLRRSKDDRLAHSVGLALRSDHTSPSADLSPREQEVFTFLLQGKTNREIADALFLSESTVKVHVRHILRKLGVRSRTEAVLKGSRGAASGDAALRRDVV